MAPSHLRGNATLRATVSLQTLWNPEHDTNLRSHTGIHEDTLRSLSNNPDLQAITSIILRKARHRRTIEITVACTQGRHRSVAYSETLTALLAERYLDAEISIFHRGQLRNWYGLCQGCVKCNLFLQGGAASGSLRDTLITNLGVLGENGPQSHPYLAITEAHMPALCTGSCTDPCKAYVRPHRLQVPLTKQRCLEGALEHPLSREPPMQLNTFKRCGILKGLIFNQWFPCLDLLL